MKSLAQDPFTEARRTRFRRRQWLLGAQFEFASDSRELLEVVDTAFGGLPAHRLQRSAPRFRVELRLETGRSSLSSPPPQPRLGGGAGLLYAQVDTANFAVVAPEARSALIVATTSMLRQPYYLRYELLEFAVLTLAARAQGLVPLHAACVSHGDRGLLLLGDSGAGKTTLCAHALMKGLAFVSEDSVFVRPGSLRATGIGSFLHLRGGAVADARLRRLLASVGRVHIRRRSGERKRVLDVRAARLRLASAPVKVAAIVLLRDERPPNGAALTPLPKSALLRSLAATQPYASGRPEWREFLRQVPKLPGYELWRAGGPEESSRALGQLLGVRGFA